jgi:hypothetical protein
MSPTFVKCEKCAKIFAKEGSGEDICPKCGDAASLEAADPGSNLRLLKNTIRDVQSRGELITIPQLVEITGIDEETVWKYISSGEIDTARFDDPMVREFMQRKRLEREHELRRKGLRGEPEAHDSPAAPKPRGFHIRRD